MTTPSTAKLYIPRGCIGLFRAAQKIGHGTTTSGNYGLTVIVDFSLAKLKKRKKKKERP